MQTDTKTSMHLTAKNRAKFPFKVSTKHFTQNCCFQESGWLFYPGSSPDHLIHGFPMRAFHENFIVTSYYTEDIIVL